MNYTIETKNLTKQFGSQIAVNNLTLSVEKGETYGFLGANGAGKTTAIKMLCGLLDPTSGKGQIAGYDIVNDKNKIRKRIGYMSQRFALYPDLSVRNNLILYGSLYGLHGRSLRKRMDAMVSALGLEEILKRPTGSLPWGWQQRLSLACANLHEPEIIFLDEPTGSVDPVSRRHFWDLIHTISTGGTTVFMTTHHMDEAEYCNRISIMANGKICSIGTPMELKQHFNTNSIHKVFIAAVERSMHYNVDVGNESNV